MSCKITKKIVHRQLTEAELLSLKKEAKWDFLRYVAKTLNFLLLFGGSPKVFSENALEARWSEEDIEKYIRDNRLENVREEVARKYTRETPKKQAYITVATDMRDKFFKSYPGLLSRITKNIDFARSHGYIRCAFGAKRNIIAELLRGPYDVKESSGMLRNLDNICANTDIQNLETSIIHPCMVDVENEFKKRGMKSRIFNMVHDSTDFFIYKPELEEACKIIYDRYEREVEVLKGVPLYIDMDVSDLTQGDYYKGGRSLEHFLNK